MLKYIRILASCWGIIATPVCLQITTEIAVQFSKTFEACVDEHLRGLETDTSFRRTPSLASSIAQGKSKPKHINIH